MEKNQTEKAFLSKMLISTILNKLDSGDDSWKMIPGLRIGKYEHDFSDKNCFYPLSLGLILQGEKIVNIGQDCYRYGAGSMIVTSVEIPTSFKVLNASKENPFVFVCLNLDAHLLTQIMTELENYSHPKDEVNAFCVAKTPARMMSSFLRLLSLTDDEQSFKYLFPLINKEIHYYALTDGQCTNLRELCINGMPNNRISKAVKWIKEHFREPVKIDELSDMIFMAPSTFHLHFKNVTSMTPLQYAKRLRLQEAKRLMMFEGFNASTAAFEVGYESVPQFSREYKRLFGKSPSKDNITI